MLVNILYVVDVTFFSTRFFASVGNWHISEICQKMANLACFKSASNLHFSFLQFWALVILKWHSFSWSLTFQKGCHPVFYRGHTHKKNITRHLKHLVWPHALRCAASALGAKEDNNSNSSDSKEKPDWGHHQAKSLSIQLLASLSTRVLCECGEKHILYFQLIYQLEVDWSQQCFFSSVGSWRIFLKVSCYIGRWED